jgi:hypothetical protein
VTRGLQGAAFYRTEDLMKRSLGYCLLLAALTPACTDGVTDDTDSCTTTVKAFPEDRATRAYYRTTVESSFSPLAPASGTLTVSGPDGNVAGTSEWIGKRLVFTPGAPLKPGGTYETTTTYECGSSDNTVTTQWTVSEVGGATNLEGLVGNGYALDLEQKPGGARFLEPEGVGGLLGTFLNFDILVAVESVDTGTNKLNVFGALGAEGQPGVQEPCTQTIDFPVADISANPYFELGPQKFSVTVEDTDVTIDNLFLSGSFAPDGSYIDGAVLAGKVDTRAFKQLVEPDNPDPADDAVCQVALSLDVECIECGGDNPGPYCLSLLVDSIPAPAITKPIERIDDPCLLDRCSAEPECATDQ